MLAEPYSFVGLSVFPLQRLFHFQIAWESFLKEYCVDYFWLTEGKGEMFIDDMDAILEELAAEKGYDADTLRIMKKLYSLPNDQFNLVMQLIDNLVEKKTSNPV